MELKSDNVPFFSLNDTKKRVIFNEIDRDQFDEDMKRRLRSTIQHEYDRCYKHLKSEWEPKLLANGLNSIPLDPDQFAELVFSQPNYSDKKARNAPEGAL